VHRVGDQRSTVALRVDALDAMVPTDEQFPLGRENLSKTTVNIGNLDRRKRRRDGTRRLLVVLNFVHEQTTYGLGDDKGRVLLSSFLDREGELVEHQVRVRADEGLLIAFD
jgi:hypothetical protein